MGLLLNCSNVVVILLPLSGAIGEIIVLEGKVRRMKVIIERAKMFKPPNRNWKYAWKWTYRCDVDGGACYVEGVNVGGETFTNDSIVELRAVLRRKYGKTIEIDESFGATV